MSDLTPGERRTHASWQRTPFVARHLPTGLMESTVLEGCGIASLLPGLEDVVPAAETRGQRLHAARWLTRVFRNDWLDEAALAEVVALQGALDGEDAILAAFTTRGVSIQAGVTRERVHVRFSISQGGSPAGDAAALRNALGLAARVLAFEAPADAGAWDLRDLTPGIVFAARVTEFARTWDETCLVVTDGVGAKCSFLSFDQRVSEAERGPTRGHIPWFRPVAPSSDATLGAGAGMDFVDDGDED